MNRAELVFIPAIGAGHILSTVEMAKLLAERDDRLSITVLIMNLRNDSNNTHSTTDRIRFVDLPCIELTCEGNNDLKYITLLVESHKSHVREAVTNLAQSGRLAGFVLDMFCTAMIDVADEFGVPSYVFFTSSAAFLGVELHALRLRDEDNVSEFNLSDAELVVPSLVNPLPPKVLPSVLSEKESAATFLEHIRGLTKAKGILVNSFTKLESHAIHSFSTGKSHCPTVYPVGPILSMKDHSLDLSNSGVHERPDIMKWLDDQPPSSVVFLCFGSMGSFGEDQVKEIALALELSGQRFLWSLRQPQQNNNVRSLPTDCTNPQEILPEGFLDRTAGTGKIIGWAPQVAILAHAAIGGFVSHCGWNSTLESLRFGVPIATWPLYAEQQFNAFEMVRELGLAVEIKIDYRKHQPTLAAEEIERGIRCVMEQESEVRKRVKQMSEASRKALMHGGSSHSALGRFIQDVMHNVAPTN